MSRPSPERLAQLEALADSLDVGLPAPHAVAFIHAIAEVRAQRAELTALRRVAEAAQAYIDDEDEDRAASFDALRAALTALHSKEGA